jgi:hypothetical protein
MEDDIWIATATAELDPLGSNTGAYNPYFNLITDPDEGNSAMMPYPSFSDLRHLGMTYSIDGISVPRDYFISTVEAHFHGSLGLALLEMSARASRPRLLESRVYYPSGQLEGKYAPADVRLAVAMAFEYHGTLERDWLVTDNWSAALNILGGTLPIIDPQSTGFKDWQQTAIADALKEAKALSDPTKGDNQRKCNEALNKLTNGKISSLNSLVSQYIASGAGQNISDGRKVSAGSYGTDSPTVPAFVLGVGTSNATTYINSKFFNFTGFGAAQARALVLLHEAVHQFGGLRDVDFDPRANKEQDIGSRNITNALIDNCAPALRQTLRGLHL